MSNNTEALTPEMARESANILIIVAARLVRMECLTPLHTLSELNQKTISTRALRDAIDRVEESLLREAGKIRDGHDRLAKKLKESEAALEQSQQQNKELESCGRIEYTRRLERKVAELEAQGKAVAYRWNYGGDTMWRLQELKPNDGNNSKSPRVIQPLYAAQQLPVVIGWVYEDDLPENYPYDQMFPFSKVDIVRMFPVYAPKKAP